jgi:hypothetical protein
MVEYCWILSYFVKKKRFENLSFFSTIASNKNSIDEIPEMQNFHNCKAISLLILSVPLTKLGTSTAAYCCHGDKILKH